MSEGQKYHSRNDALVRVNGTYIPFSEAAQKEYAFVRKTVAQHLRRKADRDFVDDAVQEAFTRATKALASYKRDSKFSSWVIQIALNFVRDYHRRSARKTEEQAMEDVLLNIPAQNSGREEAAEIAGRLEEVVYRDATRKHYEVFKLHYLDGLTTKEVAKKLKIPHETAKSRLHKLRKWCRQEKIRKEIGLD